MLKKNPPMWSNSQTQVVQTLKALIAKIPPLHIPFTETRILQIDANQDFWSILLIEDLNRVRRICCYKSGQFKSFDQNYHSTFKEILAVRRSKEKFEFHLVGHYFVVKMDMTTF